MEKKLHKYIAFTCAFFINLLFWYVIFNFYQQFKTNSSSIDPFKNNREPVVSFQQLTPTPQPVSQHKQKPIQQMVHDELHETHLVESEPLDPIPSPQTKSVQTRQRPPAQQISQQQAESRDDNQEQQNDTQQVTRAQFSQALRKALRAPAELEKEQWGKPSTTDDSNLPYHIQERIHDNPHSRYNSKVIQELKAAFAIEKKTLMFDRAVTTMVSTSITIDRLGRPVNVRFISGTTFPLCDAYILETIRGCAFAPLPARFSGNTYEFIHSARFHSEVGLCTLEYSSFFD